MSVIQWARRLGQPARIVAVALATAGLLSLTGCHPHQSIGEASPSAQDASSEDPSPSHPAGVMGLNYSTYYISSFSIKDADGNMGGGPNINPSNGDGKPAGGGAEGCCVIVPAKWTKDMTVTVQWERDTRPDDAQNRTGDQWLTAVAKVPPYQVPTRGFWVRFLPGDRIVVQVNDQQLYIPAPPENQESYIAQGVLDDEMNKAVLAIKERDKARAAIYDQQQLDLKKQAETGKANR